MSSTSRPMELTRAVRTHMDCKEVVGGFLAKLAVRALIEEVELTPKPGLVDLRGAGPHADLSLDLMRCSAKALEPSFRQIALAACHAAPGQALREELGHLGRAAEECMLRATNGVNTHRGAIWTLGLLVGGAATGDFSAKAIAAWAGRIARFTDRFAPPGGSHGASAIQRYHVLGARGEAQLGFPHIINRGLPMLHSARRRGMEESKARLDALLSIISSLDDTCLLHRGGRRALFTAKAGAREVLAHGGTTFPAGWKGLLKLDNILLALRASPGGSADLLAGVLFLDGLTNPYSVVARHIASPGPAFTRDVRFPIWDRSFNPGSDAFETYPWKY
jgi:triphosphoribosyl-dephospho-CoA synthase